MTDKTLVINGTTYFLDGEMTCFSCPEEEAVAAATELATDGAFDRNLKGDVFFFAPGEQGSLCYAPIKNNPIVRQNLPEKELKDIKIDGYESAKVLYLDQESPERKVESLTWEVKDEKAKELLETAASNLKLEKQISSDTLEQFQEVLKGVSRAYSAVYYLELELGEDKKLKVSVKEASLSPEEMKFRISGKGKVSEEVKKGVEAVISAILANPLYASILYFNPELLSKFLAEIPAVTEAPFSIEIRSAFISKGKINFGVILTPGIPEIRLFVSDEFRRFYSEQSEDVRDAAFEDMSAIVRSISASRNKADLERRMMDETINAQEGWMLGKKSGFLEFKFGKDAEGKATIEVNKYPMPTEVRLEGDYPAEEEAFLAELLKPIKINGTVDLKRGKEAAEKAKKYLEEKGYNIKRLGTFFGYDGVLHFVVELRRWERAYSLVVSNEEVSDEKSRDNSKMMAEIMAPFEGKFIKNEDMNAVKRKIARGSSRSNVEELVVTDPRTQETSVVFMASENTTQSELVAGGGGGTGGIILRGYYRLPDNGRGTSYSVGINSIFGAEVLGKLGDTIWFPNGIADWEVQDIEFLSLSFGISTTVGPDSRMGYEVYAWNRNRGGDSESAVGGSVSYTRYALNDKLSFSVGSGLEYVDVPEGVEGFNDVPVRLVPTTGVSYNDGRLKAGVKIRGTIGATNYGELIGTFSYKIPLTSSKENAPYINISASAGVQPGDVPLLEQLSRSDMMLPFQIPIYGSDMEYGRSMAGIGIELVQIMSRAVALKPIVAVARIIDSSASVSVGAGVTLLGLDFFIGYCQSLSGGKSGFELGLGFSDVFQTPEYIKYLLGSALNNRLR